MQEYEIKFLEVNIEELEKKLLSIGAKKVGEYDYRRVIFDNADHSLNSNEGWIRLRTDGKETTLAYKEALKEKSESGKQKTIGMKEIEVVVDDYEKTYDIFISLGFIPKTEARNKRIRYQKGDAVFDIDFWPFIPPYIEIESTSIEKAEEAAREIGFDPKDAFENSVKKVYAKYGYDLDDYSSITFEKMIKK